MIKNGLRGFYYKNGFNFNLAHNQTKMYIQFSQQIHLKSNLDLRTK
jgi:hypothetical protein